MLHRNLMHGEGYTIWHKQSGRVIVRPPSDIQDTKERHTSFAHRVVLQTVAAITSCSGQKEQLEGVPTFSSAWTAETVGMGSSTSAGLSRPTRDTPSFNSSMPGIVAFSSKWSEVPSPVGTGQQQSMLSLQCTADQRGDVVPA